MERQVAGFRPPARESSQYDLAGVVVHAEVVLESTVLMLGTAGIGRDPFRSLPAGGSLLYGSRDFTLCDPEDTLWSFGTYRPA